MSLKNNQSIFASFMFVNIHTCSSLDGGCKMYSSTNPESMLLNCVSLSNTRCLLAHDGGLVNFLFCNGGVASLH